MTTSMLIKEKTERQKSGVMAHIQSVLNKYKLKLLLLSSTSGFKRNEHNPPKNQSNKYFKFKYLVFYTVFIAHDLIDVVKASSSNNNNDNNKNKNDQSNNC